MSYRSLESRLAKIEKEMMRKRPRVIYIYTVGDVEGCDFPSEEAFEKEVRQPKYENAIIIRNLDRWKDDEKRRQQK